MATKDPWNNELYKAMREDPNNLKRQTRERNESKKPLTTRFLTFILAVMFVMLGIALVFIFYNNQRLSNKAISTFASSKASTTQLASSSTTSQSSTTQTSQSSTNSTASGSTYTIVSGDTPNTISTKTGVAWSTIANLNNISASGYNSDGSAIYPGQVLKLK